MAQSTDLNLRELEFFWNHPSNKIPQDWKKLAEKFHLTIIAKDSVENDNIINLPEREPKYASIREARYTERRDIQHC